MRCLSCKYDLRKLTEHRCPECGREYDPDDMTTFRSEGDWVPIAIWLALPLAFVTFFIGVWLLPGLLHAIFS